jgi:hypothetical protein
MAIRTSGKGGGDLLMMTVPVGILLIFGIITGGGVRNVLHMAELTLSAAYDFVAGLF